MLIAKQSPMKSQFLEYPKSSVSIMLLYLVADRSS